MSTYGEVPEMLRLTDVEVRSFFYEHEDKVFVVGGKEISISDSSAARELIFPKGEPIDKDQISNFPVLLAPLGGPIATPKLYTWLQKPDTAREFGGTSTVMKEVFEEVHGEKLSGRHHDTMHPMGFSAGLMREGHINLSVLGSCACLGTNPDGHLVDWHEWDSGYVELSTHNIDTDTQLISIMAGLGHLALRCGEDEF